MTLIIIVLEKYSILFSTNSRNSRSSQLFVFSHFSRFFVYFSLEKFKTWFSKCSCVRNNWKTRTFHNFSHFFQLFAHFNREIRFLVFMDWYSNWYISRVFAHFATIPRIPEIREIHNFSCFLNFHDFCVLLPWKVQNLIF